MTDEEMMQELRRERPIFMKENGQLQELKHIQQLVNMAADRIDVFRHYYESTKEDLQRYTKRIMALESQLASAQQHCRTKQSVIDLLCAEILGADYYIADPVGTDQANQLIAEDIIKKFRRKQ